MTPELILRAHLLRAQLRDNTFIVDQPNPEGEDGLREIADRHLGATRFPRALRPRCRWARNG